MMAEKRRNLKRISSFFYFLTQHMYTTFYERSCENMDIDDLIFADEECKRHSTK